MAKRTIYRASDSGRITTKEHAKKNPKTTEEERVDVPSPKPSKKK